MKTTLVVLWVLWATPFYAGPDMLMTPGWWSTRNIYTGDNWEDCYRMAGEAIRMWPNQLADAVCVIAGEAPPGPLARLKSKVERKEIQRLMDAIILGG